MLVVLGKLLKSKIFRLVIHWIFFILIVIFILVAAVKEIDNKEKSVYSYLRYEKENGDIVTEQIWYKALSCIDFIEYESISGIKYDVCNSVSVNVFKPSWFGVNSILSKDYFISIKWQRILEGFNGQEGIKYSYNHYEKLDSEFNIVNSYFKYEYLPASEETSLGKKIFSLQTEKCDFVYWDYVDGGYFYSTSSFSFACKIKIKDEKVVRYEYGKLDKSGDFKCERIYEFFDYEKTVVLEENK